MYRVWCGKISALREAALQLPAEIQQQAPTGPRRDAWLAGRVLLAQITAPLPLPEMVYGKNGKPAFRDRALPSFNLSHSGDDIALLASDEGEVGCDIEVIRPREAGPDWQKRSLAMRSARRSTRPLLTTNLPPSGGSGPVKRRG
jgi:Phosphopantetheinyl transferase